jgi:hypothetical protein
MGKVIARAQEGELVATIERRIPIFSREYTKYFLLVRSPEFKGKIYLGGEYVSRTPLNPVYGIRWAPAEARVIDGEPAVTIDGGVVTAKLRLLRSSQVRYADLFQTELEEVSREYIDKSFSISLCQSKKPELARGILQHITWTKRRIHPSYSEERGI